MRPRSAGSRRSPEFNRGDNFGNAYFQMNQRRGRRWSATKAYLRPVLGRANLTVRTGALVERVLIEPRDGRLVASGVSVSFGGGASRTVLRARREVLLAAGAIGSPQILQLSGVGPGALLAEHGIRLVRDMPGVGSNLHDHLQIRSIYTVENTVTLNRRARNWAGRAAMGTRVPAVPNGAAHDAAVAARRVREERSRATGREHRVARAAAVARQVRRAAASVRRDHAVGLQPSADEPRPRADQERAIRARIPRSR